MQRRAPVVASFALLVGVIALVGCKGCRKESADGASRAHGSAADAGAAAPIVLPEAAGVGLVEARNAELERDSLGTTTATVELVNVGGQVVTDLEISVAGLDEQGRPIFEGRHHPVSQQSYHQSAKRPLRPGDMRRFAAAIPKLPPLGRDGLRIVVTKITVESSDGG
jgi:hypothetical protein